MGLTDSYAYFLPVHALYQIVSIKLCHNTNKKHRYIRGVFVWSYWPDLNRRPAASRGRKAPERHERKRVLRIVAQRRDPYITQVAKRKTPYKPYGVLCLELLAGLEPATC